MYYLIGCIIRLVEQTNLLFSILEVRKQNQENLYEAFGLTKVKKILLMKKEKVITHSSFYYSHIATFNTVKAFFSIYACLYRYI